MIGDLSTIEILLVEDNPGDVRLTQEGLAQARMHNRLWVANDGETALRMLRQEDPHEDVPMPDLVLLDLNLPGLGGLDVLRAMRDDDVLRMVPVVVLSSSEADRDVVASYDLRANCYVTKPVDYARFVDVVHAIEQFWFSVVRRPPHQ
jgi:DNA-binding response OmpR family regulator